MSFILQGAIYTPIVNQICLRDSSMKACWDNIAKILYRHQCEFEKNSIFLNESLHYLCSTINGMMFSSGLIDWKQAYRILQKGVPTCAPKVYLDAYECASWGYALRHHLKYHHQKRIIISIMDINCFNFSFWEKSIHWGHSGFGIMTLVIQATDDTNEYLLTGCANGQNSLFEFAIAVKNFTKENINCGIALPFFPSTITELLKRLLNGRNLLSDLHSKWGHCFGSDPWISIIEEISKNDCNFAGYIISSFALNGYYTMAQLQLSKQGFFQIMEISQ